MFNKKLQTPFGQIANPNQPLTPVNAILQSTEPSRQPAFRRSKMKTIMKLVTPVIIVLVIVGLASAASYFFIFKKNPEDVIKKMFVAMSKVSSYDFNANLDSAIKAPNFSSQTGILNYAPDLKQTNSKISVSGMVEKTAANVINLDLLMNFIFEMPEDKIELGSEFKEVNNVIYLKINNLPKYLNTIPIDLSKITKDWIKIDIKELQEKYKDSYGRMLENKSLQTTGIFAEGLSEEQKKELMKTLANLNIFIVNEVLPEEEIDGVKTYHYKTSFDYQEIKQGFLEIIKIIAAKNELSQTEIDSFNKTFDRAIKTIEKSECELWIGKSDYLLYKGLAEIKVTDPQKTVNNSEGVFTLLVNFSRFNQAKNITAPESFNSLLDIITDFQEQAGISRDPRGDYDKDGLTNQMEKIFSSDPKNIDTDGDGFKDGDEVKNGYDPNGSGKIAPELLQQAVSTRNSQRTADINNIRYALERSARNNNGIIPINISSKSTEICRTGANDCRGLIDLSPISEYAYSNLIPIDPQADTDSNKTGYLIQQIGDEVIISAPKAEAGIKIEVKINLENNKVGNISAPPGYLGTNVNINVNSAP